MFKSLIISAYFTVITSGTEDDGKHNYLLRALHNSTEHYVSYSQTDIEMREWDRFYMRAEIECHEAVGYDDGFKKRIKICNLIRVLDD